MTGNKKLIKGKKIIKLADKKRLIDEKNPQYFL